MGAIDDNSTIRLNDDSASSLTSLIIGFPFLDDPDRSIDRTTLSVIILTGNDPDMVTLGNDERTLVERLRISATLHLWKISTCRLKVSVTLRIHRKVDTRRILLEIRIPFKLVSIVNRRLISLGFIPGVLDDRGGGGV